MINKFHKFIILIITVAVISGCSGFPLKQKNFFDKKEKEIIERTCKEIGLRFGYNSEIDFNYVFILSKDKQKSKNFSKILTEYEDKILFNYYLKLYRLYEMNKYLTDYYKKEKIWKNYNLMRLELLPAMELYFSQLDSFFKNSKKNLYSDLELQKPEIKKEAILYFQDKHNIVGEY